MIPDPHLPPPFPPSPPSPHDALLRMIQGAMGTELVGLMARLGLPDALRDGPRASGEVASALGLHAGALHRLMRGLVMYDLLFEDDAGRFGLTATGALLRTDVPDSMHDAACWMHDIGYPAVHGLRHTVRTGEVAFDYVFGTSLFEHLATHRDSGERFDRLMTASTRGVAREALALYDFSRFQRIFDVGGGNGAFLAEILRAHPGASGTLVDMPAVAESARRRFEAEGLAARCTVRPCDFFEEVPPGGDLYLLSRVLHDWDDSGCIRLLRRCHRAMSGRGRLLVIEQLLESRVRKNPGAVAADLEMLTMLPGRERTRDELRALLTPAGFSIREVVPVRSPAGDVRYLIEAEPLQTK